MTDDEGEGQSDKTQSKYQVRRTNISTKIPTVRVSRRCPLAPGTRQTPRVYLYVQQLLYAVKVLSMACTRSALLERRPDLPLCSLRRVRQLCAGNSVMFSSTGLDNAARDTRSLLQTPLKVGTSTRNLQNRDLYGTKNTSSVPTQRRGRSFCRAGWPGSSARLLLHAVC